MLNPERLLGHMLSGGMHSRRIRNRAALGVGLLGVAIAAFEHFSDDRKSNAASTPADAPPPPPTDTGGPPPPPPAEVSETESEEAILLIQAMVAAAHADGHVDDAESMRIMERTREAGLSPQEQSLMAQELSNPVEIDQLISAAIHYGIQGQVYAVSLMAIDKDSDAEDDYLARLADGLELNPDRVMRIHQELGE